MGLLDMYENAREVVTEYNQRSKSSMDADLAHDLAEAYNRAFEEQHAKRLREFEADAQYAAELSAQDEIEIRDARQGELRQAKEDEDYAKRLQAEYDVVVPASPARAPEAEVDEEQATAEQPSGFERTVEICKRPGEARVGLQLDKAGRDVVISAVRPGQPADLARLQVADILVAVNGKHVSSASRASSLIAAAKDTVMLTTRTLPGAQLAYVEKPEREALLGFDFAYDSKARELRIARLTGLAAECGAFEVGDAVVAACGERLPNAPNSHSKARELIRGAPAGIVSLRIVRAERAIAESLGLISPGKTPRGAHA